MDSAVYVADAEPALMVLVPDTTIRPSTERICFSPAVSEPTFQVRVLPSTAALCAVKCYFTWYWSGNFDIV